MAVASASKRTAKENQCGDGRSFHHGCGCNGGGSIQENGHGLGSSDARGVNEDVKGNGCGDSRSICHGQRTRG